MIEKYDNACDSITLMCQSYFYMNGRSNSGIKSSVEVNFKWVDPWSITQYFSIKFNPNKDLNSDGPYESQLSLQACLIRGVFSLKSGLLVISDTSIWTYLKNIEI